MSNFRRPAGNSLLPEVSIPEISQAIEALVNNNNNSNNNTTNNNNQIANI